MYINWKNKSSDDIEGLLICELPPITKANMRVEETYINGVDGSVYEDLGYESYDKIVNIGLRGNYDIDEVIDYFTGEGNITFSNETDKFYKAKIINQIDFERLLRFRTANVIFRVQPFKYSNDEGIKTFNIYNNGNYKSKPTIKITGSGTIEFKQEGVTIFSYTFSNDDTYVEINSDKQDAYVGTTLKNRNMLGEFPNFKTGKNTITWTGTITKFEISNYSRWL